MTKLCGGLIDYKEIHDSFYGVKSLVVQLDEIVHRYKTACEKTRFPSINNDSIIKERKIFASTPVGRQPQCRLNFSDGDDKTQLCQNSECPYAPPPPCSFPHCPFRKEEVPQKPELPDDNLNICPNPECPYNETDRSVDRSRDCCVAQDACFEESLNTEATRRSSDQEQDYETTHVSETRVEIDTTPCRPATCFKHAGALECENCLEPIETPQKSKKRQKMLFSKKPYEWSPKDQYPGYHIGHQYCCTPSFRVPPKQGWLWNISLPCMGLKPRIGWRPGAVSRRLAACIRKHRRLYERMLHIQKYGSDAKIVDKNPHLYVVKKQGDYMVTVNPIDQPKGKPLQFKIEKNAPEERSCYCGDDDSESSSDGFDFEIKSPTRIRVPKSRKKTRKHVTKETQYNPADFQTDKGKGKKGKGKKGKDKKNKKNKKKKK